MARPKIIVITGPTASGKSNLGVDLSRKFDGEVVSADSRQVYKYLDIGTGKITKKEMKGIPHHCLDISHPRDILTVEEFRKRAEEAVTGIYQRGKIPFVVGGTGFYINAIIYGDAYPRVKPNWRLRRKLENISTTKLFNRLQRLDHQRASSIEPHNKRRLIRALEIIEEAGWIPVLRKVPRFSCLILGIKKNPEKLRHDIQVRLTHWLDTGMVDEIKNLHQKYKVPWSRFDELGFDYKYLALYLQGKVAYEDAIAHTERGLWQYSRRQMTYFKKMPGIRWITTKREAEKLVREFLK